MKHGIYYAYWEQEWAADYLYYIDKAARLGFDILEIGANPLPGYSKQKLRDLRSAAKTNNIILTVGYGPSPEQNIASPDAAVRENGMKFFTDLFSRMELMGASLIGGGLYHYWPVNYSKSFDKQQEWGRSVESIQKLAPIAKDCGVTLCMEVLNRFEGFLLNTAAEGVDFVRQVGQDNVKVMLDTFHMNIEEESIGNAIRTAGEHLGHFHTGECNRTVPGTGRVPWREIRDALHDINYNKAIVMEPFIRMGGTVGRDIKLWRDLSGNAEEEQLDAMAQEALWFQRYMLD
jgi:D-psicose/D-tagatose/L-ribulose 3-epimerase